MKTSRPTECTCGKCHTGTDAYGNLDYGQRWSEKRGTYVARNCPVAQEAARQECSVEELRVSGWLR